MSLSYTRYIAQRRRTAEMTSSHIDDKLNTMSCDAALRDEIVERLAAYESLCRQAQEVAAALREEALGSQDGTLLEMADRLTAYAQPPGGL